MSKLKQATISQFFKPVALKKEEDVIEIIDDSDVEMEDPVCDGKGPDPVIIDLTDPNSCILSKYCLGVFNRLPGSRIPAGIPVIDLPSNTDRWETIVEALGKLKTDPLNYEVHCHI